MALAALFGGRVHAAEPDLVVEAEAYSDSDADRARGAVTVIEVDDRLPDGADLADAVARAPGTTVRRLGGLGAFSAVSLRGAALRQVQVHLDGIPLNPDGSAAFNLSQLPLRAFSDIEVWRGAGPARLAAAPLGGVIDLRTARQAESPLTLEASLGSWRTGRAAARGGTVVGGTEVLGAVEGLSTRADFVHFDDNGTDARWLDDRLADRLYNDKRQVSGLLRLRSVRAPVRRTGLIVLNLRDEGLPGPVGARPDGRLRTAWALASGELAGRVGLATVRARGWAQLRDERFERPAGPATTERQAQAGAHLSVDRPWALGDLGAAVQLRRDARLSTQLDALAAGRWSTTLVAHGTVEPLGEALTLEGVAQAQAWLERRGDERITRLAPLPRVGLRWRAAERLTVRAAAGRAVRPPDFLELFGDRGPVRGRADLRPERGTWADAGLRWHGDVVRAELGGFAHYAVDRIVFVQNSQRELVPINLGQSWVGGIEAGADLAVEPLDVRGALTVSPSFVLSDVVGLHGKRLPRIPLVGGTAEVGLSAPGWGRISYDLAYASQNAWDEANLFVAPPRLLHGLAVRVTPDPRLPTVGLSVRNVGNTLVQAMDRDPLNPRAGRVLRPITDFAGYPLPGRTALLTLTWTPRPS